MQFIAQKIEQRALWCGGFFDGLLFVLIVDNLPYPFYFCIWIWINL